MSFVAVSENTRHGPSLLVDTLKVFKFLLTHTED